MDDESYFLDLCLGNTVSIAHRLRKYKFSWHSFLRRIIGRLSKWSMLLDVQERFVKLSMMTGIPFYMQNLLWKRLCPSPNTLLGSNLGASIYPPSPLRTEGNLWNRNSIWRSSKLTTCFLLFFLLKKKMEDTVNQAIICDSLTIHIASCFLCLKKKYASSVLCQVHNWTRLPSHLWSFPYI